jgi:2-C-methyl-D-erythritol 4-phosphate cytidylyltransferase
MVPAVRCHALVPCGGVGSRAGAGVPKQYRQVAGLPVLAHTLQALAAVPEVSGTLVVIAEGDVHFDELRGGLGLDGWRAFNPGLSVARRAGATRAATVLAGLDWLVEQGGDAGDWVLVHDAARCLVQPSQVRELIGSVWAAAGDDPLAGGLLAQPLADTLKAAEGGRVVATVPRADKWLAQTPQLFRLGALRVALRAAEPGGFAGVTDEASAMEAVGGRPLLVMAQGHNVKLTYPEDFVLAEALLQMRRRSATA